MVMVVLVETMFLVVSVTVRGMMVAGCMGKVRLKSEKLTCM